MESILVRTFLSQLVNYRRPKLPPTALGPRCVGDTPVIVPNESGVKELLQWFIWFHRKIYFRAECMKNGTSSYFRYKTQVNSPQTYMVGTKY